MVLENRKEIVMAVIIRMNNGKLGCPK